MFENAILAILKFTPSLGAVQLRKAICIADAVHNSLHGKSITGCRYIKEKLGPVPDADGENCLKELYKSKKITIARVRVGCHVKHVYNALIEPDNYLFTESQANILKYAAELVASLSAKELSDKTHDAVYHSLNMGDEIPLDEICKPMVIEDEEDVPLTEEMLNEIKRYFEQDENRLRA